MDTNTINFTCDRRGLLLKIAYHIQLEEIQFFFTQNQEKRGYISFICYFPYLVLTTSFDLQKYFNKNKAFISAAFRTKVSTDSIRLKVINLKVFLR